MGIMYEFMEITSSYIFSKFSEKSLKQLFEAYSTKVLLNGRMPPLEALKEYNKFVRRVINLYRVFYFGE